MSFFDHNCQVLKRYHETFEKEILDKFSPSPDVEVEETTSGAVTARYGGIYLHSKRDPVDEAYRLVKLGDFSTAACCVSFGFGLGYFAEAFLQSIQNVPLIVIEPDVPLFLAAFASRRLEEILSSPRVSFLLGAPPDALGVLLNSYRYGQIQILAPRSLQTREMEYFIRIQAVLSDFISRREVNKNTLARFGRLWIRNLTKNMPLIPHAKSVATLTGALADIPAVVLAAGPSLDMLIPHLSELKKRCVLIAVDTSCRACIQRGIQPDFIVVVDPQYWNARHMDGCRTNEAILVSESSTYPAIFRNTYRALFFCDSLFPLGQYVENQIGSFGRLGAGGSVATSAWDLARLLGCGPIYCAGLDLGFPDAATHYQGALFEEMKLSLSSRLKTVATSAFLMMHDAQPYPVESNDHHTVLTDRRLIIYKWWFENQLKIHAKTDTKNLSPKGVLIEGMDPTDASLILKHKPNRKKIAAALNTLTIKTADDSAKPDLLFTALTNLINEMNRIVTIAAEAEDLSQRLVEGKVRAPEALYRRLDIIDQQILESFSRDIVGFLAQEEAYAILEENYQHSDSDDILRASAKLYSQLAQAGRYHLVHLNRACEGFLFNGPNPVE